jgi:hypothetical protein
MRSSNEAAVPAAVESVDARPATQDLLVLVGHGRDPRDALRLPFRDATVLDADADLVTTRRTFDVITLECGQIDLASLDDLLCRKVLPALCPDGRVLVALDNIEAASAVPLGPDGHEPILPGLDTVEWLGVSVVNGRPFAVLGRGVHPPTSAARAMAAAMAALAASHHATIPLRDGSGPRSGPIDPTLMRQLLDHRRHEQALRERLEAVTAALKARRSSGWFRRLRRVVGRSRVGPVLRRVRRFARQAAAGR